MHTAVRVTPCVHLIVSAEEGRGQQKDGMNLKLEDVMNKKKKDFYLQP